MFRLYPLAPSLDDQQDNHPTLPFILSLIFPIKAVSRQPTVDHFNILSDQSLLYGALCPSLSPPLTNPSK